MRFGSGCLLLMLLAWCGDGPLPAAEVLEHLTWTVDGVTREALANIPAATETGGPVPVVFAFHGHGGSMRQAARSFSLHAFWPGAIVVYPQGLPTPGSLTDAEGKRAGWQPAAGRMGDRDLRFFDVMLAEFRTRHRIDDRRIYATGHSNGGQFTYLLWAERGDVFAALAPSAAVLSRGFQKFQPKPVLHIGSPQDPLVKFVWQASMIDHVLKLNGCDVRNPDADGYTSYPSSRGDGVATYLHSRGHRYPDEATEIIVTFFKAQVRPEP